MTKREFINISLSYGLVILDDEDYYRLLIGIHDDTYHISYNNVGYEEVSDIKPILHPLSDLTKPINGKMPLSMCFEPCSDDRNTLVDLSHGLIDINNIRFKLVLDLVKRHYDVCNLISKGDAIDINTLPENPYK